MNESSPYPIYADISSFENEAQVEKINTIIKSEYNKFLTKSKQKEYKYTPLLNIVKSSSNNCANILDYNYGDFNFISMDFSTSGIEPNTIYPVLSIKKGYVPIINGVKPQITFTGVKKNEEGEDDDIDLLNGCGEFIFTYNEIEKESQISFVTRPDATITQTSYHVTMNFFYRILGGE